MSEHNHTGLDEAASVASNTMQAVRTGKAMSAAAKGAAAGGPYGAAIGAALSARKHIGKIAAAALVLLALPLLFILLLPGIIFGSLTDSGASGAAGQPILNDNAAITENVNQAAFAINQILGEGIENVRERIANDFAGTDGDHYWCSKSGSYHTLIPGAAQAWGLSVEGCTASEPQRILDALADGKLVVALMTKGHFTKSGHFIVLRGVQDEKILVADPASYRRSQKTWDLSIILNEASRRAGAGGPFWIIG